MEINLPGEPISTNNIYRHSSLGGFHRTYMKREGVDKKNEYSWQFKGAVKKQKGWKLDGLYEVEARLFFKDKRPHDIDNYSKILLDSASKIVWNDDKQVMKMTLSKAIDREHPRVEVVIHMI